MVFIRFFIVICFCLVLSAPVHSEDKPLKASVSKEWSIEEVRKIAFENVENIKDLSNYPAIDPNFEENQIAIKSGKSIVGNRFIMYFSKGGYGIKFIHDKMFSKGFYFNIKGELEAVQFEYYNNTINTLDELIVFLNNKSAYPIRAYKYSYPDGKLFDVCIDIEPEYQYFFYPNGKLKAYWIDNKCYDPDGNLINERSTKPFTEE